MCNVIKEMRRLRVNITRIAEARWTKNGKVISNKMTIHWE